MGYRQINSFYTQIKHMQKVPIVFCFDNNLVRPACVALSSLMMNAKEDTFYDIFILHSWKQPLNHEDIDRLPLYYKNSCIQYRTVDSTFDEAFEIRGITTAAYYRLLIPELIPEYDKVLYSDVDVIFRSDLSEFYSTDMTGYYVAGVDSLANFQPELVKYYNDIVHINPEGIIFSGNLVINSKEILKDNLIPRFKELAKNRYTFQDMDVLNIACRGKIKYLSPAFCLTTYISEYSVYRKEVLLKVWSGEKLSDALSHGIVHYNGKKPWNDVCINFDIWWEYYRKCPYYDEKRYFDFFNYKLNELDRLSLMKRIKVLLRYFL